MQLPPLDLVESPPSLARALGGLLRVLANLLNCLPERRVLALARTDAFTGFGRLAHTDDLQHNLTSFLAIYGCDPVGFNELTGNRVSLKRLTVKKYIVLN